jgi:ELWxxDGT repeat protein
MLNPHVIQIVSQYLAQFAATTDFESTIESIFGTEIDRVQLVTIRQQWLDGDFSVIPSIDVVANGELMANGGYAAALDKILVSSGFLAQHQNDLNAIAGLLLEEVGHKIDRVLNGNVDSPGDEGAMFRSLVTGQSLSSQALAGLRAENDRAVIVLDGNSIEIEKADAEPYLVADINQNSYGSNPNNFYSVGGFLYFTANNDTSGTELWQVNQSTGVATVVEINPGSASSNPTNLIGTGNTLYFTANNPTNGTELWKIVDGGVPTVVDLYLGANGSSPTNFVNVGGTIYFIASGYNGTTSTGSEIWKIDPVTGNSSVIELVAGSSTASPNSLVNVNGTLYFTAYYNGGTYTGLELYKLDGNTPVFLKDIYVGTGSSSPGNLTYSNGKLYFTADNYTEGVELWETDGTAAGTKLTQDINTSTYGSSPTNFISVGSTLYFIANNQVSGSELWKADAGGNVSIVELAAGNGGINPGDGSANITNLTNINGTLYFQAYNPTNGSELWKIDTSGTLSQISLYAGANSSSPDDLINIGGTLYFTASGYDGVNSNTNTGNELWRIDPTTGNPTVISIVSGSGASNPSNLTNIGGILYFQAYTAATGYELWKVDPANNLPVLVSDLYAGGNSSSPTSIIGAGGSVYFVAENGTSGREIFRVTGNAAPEILDIRTGTTGSNPTNLIDVGGILYFLADNGTNGRELWKANPTGAPVQLEINSGSGSSNINYLTNVGGKLYFQAYDPTNGYDLWKIGSDGNPARIDLGTGGSNPTNLTNVNGTLYFRSDNYYSGTTNVGYGQLWKLDSNDVPSVIQIGAGINGNAQVDNITLVGTTLFFSAYDATNGVELWKLDASGNAVLVKDIQTGSGYSYPDNFFAVGGTLYFTANDGVKGVELWKSDGTSAGTVLAKDINGRTLPSNPTNLINVGNTLYFLADNGINGQELWKVDPTTGNPVQLEINSGSQPSYATSLTNIGGKLYFQAYDPTNGYDLWKIGSDGNPARIDLGTGGSNPTNLTNVNGTLYFRSDNYYSGTTNVGYGQLWKLDSNDVPSVIQIGAGINGNAQVDNITLVGTTLFFSAYDATNGVELWKLDASGNAVLVKDIQTGSGYSYPDNFFAVGGTLYFTANDGVKGVELWKSDGTSAGTVLAKDINGRTLPSNPTNLINVGNTLYFLADNGINGQELWKVDPTTGNPVQLEINSGSQPSYVTSLTNIGGKLYFQAYDPTNGYDLWKIGSDGNPARIDLGTGGSNPTNLTNVNGTLYFRSDNSYSGTTNVGYGQLWKLDSNDVPSVIQIGAGINGNAQVDNITLVGTTLFFSAYDATNGVELWKLDASGNAVLVKDIRTGSGYSSPDNFYNVNGTLYFTANDGTNGTELWKSDGTAAGTVNLEINAGATSTSIANMVEVAGTVYFTAQNATNGQELWRINAAGNPEVLDINAGTGASNPSNLTNVNGTLYFQAYDPTNGYELWKVVGASGTPTLINLYNGSGSSSPSNLLNLNGTLYFTASGYNGTTSTGSELWKIDANGNPSVIELVTGSTGGSPTNLTNVNGNLYFTAYYNGSTYTGLELWKLDAVTGTPVFLKDINVGSTGSDPGSLTYSNGKLYFSADNLTEGRELWAYDISSINTVGNVPKTGTEDQAITFAASDFASVFTSNNGGSLASIRVVALPSNGTLKLNNANVTANQEILAANLGSLTFTPNANFNGNAAFTWNGSDGTTYATSPATVSMSIAPVNDAPELVNAIPNLNIYSNNIANFSISGNAFRDVDLDNLTYSATLADGSALPTWLALNGTNFSGTPPISAIGQNIEIKVTAKDPSNTTATDNFFLNILSSAPTYIYLSNGTVAENSADGTQVGVLTANDPSTNDTQTYTLLNDAGGRFSIADDKLVVANSSLLDYETNTQHTIRVRTTDSTGLTYERDIAVNVSNVNDANAGTLSFTAPTYSVNENGTTVAAVTVQRTNGSEGFIRANIILGDGTATAPGDYNAAPLVVEFANGETSKTVTIPIVNDTATEANETINLTLTNLQGGATLGTQSTAVLTIIDNDPLPAGSLAFASNSYSVNENGIPSVTILRTIGSTGAVTVNIVPTNGTAISPGDFNTAPISVSFADGETSKTVALNSLLNDDAINEQTENLILTLSAPTGGAVLGTQQTTNLNILDNDAVPGVVQFSSATYSINEDGTPVTAITLTRTGGTDGAISVQVNLGNGTATAPGDYTNNSIAVSFANGESSKTIVVPIDNDTLIEGNETVNLTLTNPTGGATLGTQQGAVLTIVDNDFSNLNPGVLSFTNSTYSFNESGSPVATVTIDRTGGSDGAISTSILLNGGTATAGIDYTNNPITVNFADGETTKTVTIPIANDTVVESTETFNLTLSNPTGGATIDPTKNTTAVSILDDDVQLSFSGASYSVNENGTAISNITVTRSGRSIGAVSATLSFTDGTAKGCVCAANSVNNDFYNGTFVVDFADGETSKVIPVQLASLGGTNAIRVRDDAKVEGDEFFTISLINPTGGATIGAQNNATVTIIDNDSLPVLTVSFSQNTIAENAGVGAVTGTVTRDVATDAALVVTLASSDTTEAKVPQQVTIAAGQTSATFSIDAVDDTILDGNQNVTITATPLNGDTSIPLTGSAATGILQVTDSESPSLTLSIDREIVAETGTALATITRNTNTSNDLVVTIASSDTTEATAPQTVTILAGQTSANFTVSGVNDAITDGSQPVTITAAASGFTSSIKAINVTDIDVPDLVLTQLNPAVPTYTSKQSTFSYKLENKGIIAATAPNKPNTNPVEKDPWIDRVYLSTDNILDSNDKLLGEFPFSGSVAPGSFYERNITYFAPKTPGQYYLIGVTDATNKINEGIGESNNTVITPITVTPAYKATVSTDVTIANIGTNVILRGQANSTQDNSPVAFEFVKIKVENKGIIRELDAFTDGNGNFVKQFNPLPGEGGTYNINAYFPNNPSEDTAPEDSFKLLGMRFEQNDQRVTSIGQKVFQGTTFNGSIKLQNLSDEALSGLTGSIVGAPSNWTVNINPAKTTLAGDEEITVNYTIDVPDNSIRNDIFEFELTTTEGVSVDIPVTIDVVPIVPKLVASTTLIKSGMLRGNQSFVEVEITNEGGDTANNIKVLLPDAPWLSLTSPTVIPTLAPGETTKVTLRLSPDATLPLTEYNGNLFLDVEGNDGDLSLPFNFRAVSNAVGDVKINISDELTYFAEGAPKLAGATVKILDYFTKEVIGTTVSDATGIVNFANIKEGAYELEVTAEDHDTFKQTIQLDAGEFENVNAFLSRQAVKYIWTVTPTEIQDKYTISIESVFETDVPVPTIVIDPPLIDLADLTVVGQVKQIEMTMTNHGLIAANSTKLNFGSHPFYKIETIVDEIGTISAKSSITVPVRITRIADFSTLPSSTGELTPSQAAPPSVPCSISADVSFLYVCAGRQNARYIPLPILNVSGNCGFAFDWLDPTPTKAPTGSGDTDPPPPPPPVPVTINFISPLCGPVVNSSTTTSETVSFTDNGNQFANEVEDPNKSLEKSADGSVCATVKLKIDQDAVLTRAAFLGELEIDNGSGSSLTNLSVNLQIKDENGNVVNELFGIDSPILKNINAVNGTGVLTGDDPNTPQDEGIGSAKWTFIPTNLAAPETPTKYTIGGTLAYIENGKAISVPLFSTPVTVYPQAELYLDYFHQRDVFADDPFTPETEVSVPYNLAVLVQNQGKGDAKNLSITSGQPKIVDNEKGLLIDFNIIGSQVNNESVTPSLSVNFGTIEAGQTGVATWLLKSSLQGKFIDYKATFEHVNSLGKKELSLIKDVKIHELTRQVKVNHTNPDNLADFLVNDTFDANFYPDTLYFSSGGTAPVTTVTTATTDGNASNLDLEVKVTATVDSGWNYIRLADPANGQFQVKKVLRADGTEVNIENIWTTDRTFPGTGRPVYENILNLFDYNATAGNAQYTVLYTTGDNAGPKVREILDVDPNPRTTPVTSLDVVFSEAIESTTFDFNDFTLTRDGGANLITSAVTVTKINDTTYRINNLTGITGNVGDYQLSVNASGVKDIEGDAGVGTVTENWLVNGNKPAVASVAGIASNRRNTPVDNVTITFTEALNPTSFDLSDILLTRDNGANLVNGDVSISQINATTYQINGLTNLTNIGGEYQLLIQATGVTDTDGNTGVGGKGFNWKLDGANPVVSDIIDLQVDPRNAPVSSLDVKLSESIDLTTFTYEDITLTLNGGANLITSGVTVAAVDDTTYRINGLNGLTTADGNYTLTVNGSGIADNFGNAGIGSKSETWLMDTIAPTTPTSLLVAGTSPNAGKFLINTTNPTITGLLGETGLQVFFYDKTSGNNLGQATVTGTTFTGTVALPTNGAQDLEIRVQDAAGNITNTPLNLFADITKPAIVEFLSVPTSSVNPVDTLDVRFSEPIDLTTFNKNDLTLTRDGVALTLPDTVTVEFVSGNTYRIKGLQGLTTPLGSYQLQVDATTIKDNAGNSGDAPKTATFSIVAPPTPGITFTQTSGNTSVTEGGNTDTYSLILKTQPTADVTINLAFGNQITTDKNTLTFTAANWNVAQNITVTAVDDTTPEGNHTANITHTVSSTDTTYNTITLPNLNVNINDNDAEIRGLKWNDLDGDGIKDTNESGLKDWKIYLDTNTNGQLDTGEVSTTTDNDGNYSFTNLRPGTYTVTEEMQPGWKQTFPGVSVTTTSSDIQLTTPSSPLTTTAAASGTAATNLVNLDNLWSDARFSNIKGNGYSTVIIDTGADLNHPLFGADADNNGIADKIVYQYDFADNDTDASDKNNHGSHIASIASAVAPDANLIVLKVFKDSGTGSFADLEEALQWVNTNSDIYNIASVNLSLGDGKNWNTPMSRYGIGDELAAIASQNVLISAAAGNGFYTYNSVIGLAYPAIDPSVISVGAVWTDDFGARTFSNGAKDNTTAPDRITSFSQRSPLLDVFAPGILITGANATGGTTTMGGTSQATPYISGIATLAQQIAKTNLGRVLTLAEFDTLLNTTSDLIIDGDDENDNITNTGVSYPRINVLSLAESILNLSSNGGGTTTPNNPTDNGNQEPLKIPDTNLNLVHTVTLTAGQVANNLNFGNQKLNQLPTLTNISKSASENASITFSSNDFTSAFSDADGNSLTKIKIASLPANGTFQLDGVGVTLDREIAVSELDKLVFTPNLNYGGNISFNWNGFDGTEYATNSAQANLKIVPLPRIGTSEKDNLVGTDGDDTISGLAGDDILDGGAGIDDLYGSDGSDELYGDAGNDTLSGDAGEDGLYGGDGNDILNGGLDNDELVGDAGDDILDGGAGIDDLYGSDGSDELYGDAGNDTLSGDAGDDGLYGGDGNDILNGGLDNDELVGDAGDDILDGGAGIDDLYGSDGSDELYGDAGNDTLSGDAGEDGLYGGDGNDILNGGLDNDELVGDAGDDILDGGAGIDDLYGSDGSDELYGDAGNDTLSGGDGDDTLNGGFGNDILMGNGGANIFEFDSLNDGIDTIIDFSSSRDKLQFSAASFGGGLSSAVLFNSDLLLTGSGADTATNASQRFIHNTDNGNLYFDVDGIGGARQVQIGILYNLSSLNTNNFAIV